MPSTTSSHGSETTPPTAATPPDSLGYDFDDPSLLELALRHRSWCAENGGVPSNERLEFLGDSVLGVAITDNLYGAYDDEPEGVLARRRAELVNTVMLAEIAREVGLGEAIKLGKGEESTGGRDKPSILADALEAVFGAVFRQWPLLAVGVSIVVAISLGLIADAISARIAAARSRREA